MSRDLTQGSIKEHTFSLAIPAVMGYFFHTLFNLTDTYFAGLVSTQALAALSLSSSLFFMILAIGIGMSEALTSMLGNALGKNDLLQARNITRNGLIFAFLLSLFVSFGGVIATPHFVTFLGDTSYLQETLDYINIILYGSVFFVMAFFLSALLNAVGDTTSFRNVLFVTALLNVGLDYYFVYYLHLEVLGIAFSTLLCEMLTVIYLFYKLSKTKLWERESKSFKFNVELIKELFSQGLPPSANMFLMAFGIYVITYYIAPFGKEAVAAFGIGMRIEQVFLMPVIGLNIAALAIISQNNGAQAYERIEPTLRLGIRYGWMMSTLGVSIFLLFAEFLASLLSSDALVIQQSALYLRVSGVASYAFVIIFLYIAMLQGIAKPAMITPISIYRQLIAPVLVFSVLAYFGFDILWFWMGLNGVIFSAAIFLWWYAELQLKKLQQQKGAI